ncbi:hypothetical protein [Gluconobacter oxydans]|uniref:hypothetical protein n=1 Tax=Gluconobacter oxydans TaxID=442 RepID=UPI0002FC683F|nr:hypothetical protein [Gluconobacter oxydans]
MSEVNEISVTPKGMGALVAEITEGAGDQAFLSKYAEVCRTLVARWKSDGHSQEQVRDFALQFAEGATMRRAKLARGVQIPHMEGRA